MNLLVCGVGGNGVLLVSNVLKEYFAGIGTISAYEGKGHARRGGTVFVHLRINESGSYLIPKGKVDFMVALEPLEAIRFKDILNKKGLMLISPSPIFPIPVLIGEQEYPDTSELISNLDVDYKIINAQLISEELGNKKVLNVVMLGALVSALSNIDKEKIKKILLNKIPKAMRRINSLAFDRGYDEFKK